MTGLAPVPAGPVLAVKIDDTGNGRPQHGVDLADIVYIEQAEGGLSRLVAVFGTNKPVAEPVRSVRTSDPELLLQYGQIALVASGGGGGSLPTLYQSGLNAVIDDRGDPGLSRDNNRDQPYNLTADLSKISSLHPSWAGAQSIGFTWSADPAPLAATPTANEVDTRVGSTPVQFRFDAASAKYARYINGNLQHAADGNVIATPNVIVQFCQVSSDPSDVDVNGNPSQYTHSVGSGQVAVFRNGHRVDGTWTRASNSSGTTLTDGAGQPIALAPGGAWVVLVATGAALSSS
ncbi:MAG: DUF3048 C-terminal domain-containing protein [Actinobacteria bacterium]|nr:DUF3048 C-terminal domain-containing protein [Actinomycetota bacterium]